MQVQPELEHPVEEPSPLFRQEMKLYWLILAILVVQTLVLFLFLARVSAVESNIDQVLQALRILVILH